VQSSGDLVGASAEFSPRVQHREYDFGRGLAGVVGVVPDGDASSVVDDSTTAVGQNRDINSRAKTSHRLVDRIVDNLPDQVVQSRRPRRADIHARSDPNRFETLENGDVARSVASGSLGLLGHEEILSISSFSAIRAIDYNNSAALSYPL